MTTTINPVDLQALLEDGPHTEAELAKWLAQPAEVTRFVLKQLQTEGKVQKAGDRGWVLTPARLPAATWTPLEQQLLSLLDAGPRRVGELKTACHTSANSVRRRLEVLAQAQQVKRLGTLGVSVKWARFDWTPPPAPPPAPVLISAPAAATQPPPDRPAKVIVENTGSWWVPHADPALPRERFTTAAKQRDAEMCAGNSNWRRPTAPNTQVRPPVNLREML